MQKAEAFFVPGWKKSDQKLPVTCDTSNDYKQVVHAIRNIDRPSASDTNHFIHLNRKWRKFSVLRKFCSFFSIRSLCCWRSQLSLRPLSNCPTMQVCDRTTGLFLHCWSERDINLVTTASPSPSACATALLCLLAHPLLFTHLFSSLTFITSSPH
jgi:hypothetical protein